MMCNTNVVKMIHVYKTMTGIGLWRYMYKNILTSSAQTMDNSYHHAVPQNAATPIQIDTHISAVNVMNCKYNKTEEFD